MSAMKYVGDGSFIVGVPARDLSADEAERLAEMIAGSPLYEPVVEAQAAPAAASTAAPAETAQEGGGAEAVGARKRKGD